MHHRRFFWTLQRMRHAPILIPSGFIGITIAAWGMHVRNDDCGISSRAYDLGSRLIVTHHMHQGICDSIRFRYSQCRDIRFAFLFIGLFVDQSIHTRLLLWMRGLRPRWRSRPVQLLSSEKNFWNLSRSRIPSIGLFIFKGPWLVLWCRRLW